MTNAAAPDPQPDNDPAGEPAASGRRGGAGPEIVWYAPPVRPPRRQAALREAGTVLGAAFLLVLATGLLGALGGATWRSLSASLHRWRDTRRETPDRMLSRAERLRRARALRDRHPVSPESQFAAARLFLDLAKEAEAAPAALHRQEAAVAADAAWRAFADGRDPETIRPVIPTAAYRVRTVQAAILGEAGRSREALAIYEALLAANPADGEEADRARRERARLFNDFAWLLLTAEAAAVRDPDRALALARACVKLHPEASRNASLLDTLAMAYYRTGDAEQALAVQRRALALAGPGVLPELIERFDRFAAAAGERGGRRDGDAD